MDPNHGDIESVLLDGWVSQLIYELVAYSVTMKRKSKTPPVVVFLQRSDICDESGRGVKVMTSFFSSTFTTNKIFQFRPNFSHFADLLDLYNQPLLLNRILKR